MKRFKICFQTDCFLAHKHTSTDGLCIKMTSKYQYDTNFLIEIHSENKCRHRLNITVLVLVFCLPLYIRKLHFNVAHLNIR